jgi:hypothetical protein
LFLNFSELFELTLTDPPLAPPSGESCVSINNYLFIDVRGKFKNCKYFIGPLLIFS